MDRTFDSSRRSAWQEDSFLEDEPAKPELDGGGLYELRVSRQEMQMLMHLRMLGGGVHAIRVEKNGKGMLGLSQFRFMEVAVGERSQI